MFILSYLTLPTSLSLLQIPWIRQNVVNVQYRVTLQILQIYAANFGLVIADV